MTWESTICPLDPRRDGDALVLSEFRRDSGRCDVEMELCRDGTLYEFLLDCERDRDALFSVALGNNAPEIEFLCTRGAGESSLRGV